MTEEVRAFTVRARRLGCRADRKKVRRIDKTTTSRAARANGEAMRTGGGRYAGLASDLVGGSGGNYYNDDQADPCRDEARVRRRWRCARRDHCPFWGAWTIRPAHIELA
ncbi:hypothetical protein MRX96_012014 [Rhipicephalus microplus]